MYVPPFPHSNLTAVMDSDFAEPAPEANAGSVKSRLHHTSLCVMRPDFLLIDRNIIFVGEGCLSFLQPEFRKVC